jgi:hypothetical protein
MPVERAEEVREANAKHAPDTWQAPAQCAKLAQKTTRKWPREARLLPSARGFTHAPGNTPKIPESRVNPAVPRAAQKEDYA